nr:T9SS type A sorting domain-containing protein [Chitinophagaceae bacterium]
MHTFFFVLFAMIINMSVWAQLPCGLDQGFNGTGLFIGDGSKQATALLPLADGKIIICNNPVSNLGHSYLKRYHPDGSLDISFGSNGKFDVKIESERTTINAMEVYNNKIYCCGTTYNGTTTLGFICRLKIDGGYDSSFSIQGVKTMYTFNTLEDLIIDNTGKIFLAGTSDYDVLTLMKLQNNGTTDNTFGNVGRAQHQTPNVNIFYNVYDVALDASSNIVITGKYYTLSGSYFRKVFVAKIKPSGVLDSTFDADGVAYYNSGVSHMDEARKIFPLNNGDYCIAVSAQDSMGTFFDFALLKIKGNGLTDNTFGVNGWKLYDLGNNTGESVTDAAMLSNGNYLLSGNHGFGDTIRFTLLMLKPDGSREPNFAPNGLFTNIFGNRNNNATGAMAVSAQGKIYLGGYARTCANGVCGPLSLAVARYHGAETATSIPDFELASSAIICSPNPILSKGLLKIMEPENVELVQLVNALGQAIPLQKVGAHLFQLPECASGIYFLQARSNRQLISTKLLVQ